MAAAHCAFHESDTVSALDVSELCFGTTVVGPEHTHLCLDERHKQFRRIIGRDPIY